MSRNPTKNLVHITGYLEIMIFLKFLILNPPPLISKGSDASAWCTILNAVSEPRELSKKQIKLTTEVSSY